MTRISGFSHSPQWVRLRTWAKQVRRGAYRMVLVTPFLPVTTLPPLPPQTLQGLPYVAFSNTGTGTILWNAHSLEPALANATLQGTPSVISGDGTLAIAARTANGDLVLYERPASGPSQIVDLTTELPSPAPGSDPTAFFDPWHNVDVAYVGTNGDLLLLTPTNLLRNHHERARSRSPYAVTDLTLSSGVTFAPEPPSIAVSGTTGSLVAGDAGSHAEFLTLTWAASNQPPSASALTDVTDITLTPALAGAPVVVPNASTQALFCAVLLNGDVMTFQQTSSGGWGTLNVTVATNAPTTTSALETAVTPTTEYVAGLGADGSVQLFSVATGSELGSLRRPHIITRPTSTWSYVNVTQVTVGGPPLDGTIALAASNSTVTIAGSAQHWGDLFAYSAPLASSNWTATDLSQLASNAAQTVSATVQGAFVNGQLTLFAFANGFVTNQGVGLYAIPQADNARAISDGWPILSDTGGLGTTRAPWVGFVTSGGVAQSPDFLLGQAIQQGHRPVTWLSFWTASGPLNGQSQSTGTYYAHGLDAGKWVAQQIDAYKTLGLTQLPNWIIFDPEGYPDNHSHLDAPPGASNATIARYATYWKAMVKGWIDGLASVDSSLHPGLYASQSEYRNYHLVDAPLPIFEAVAFGGGGPYLITGGTGPNVRGYIAFSATCTPRSTLKKEEATLMGAPWFGQFNTLQFNAGVYCAP